MSSDSARAFLDRLQADSDFRHKLLDVTRTQGHIGRSIFINKEGFDFSVDDLNQAKKLYTGKIPKDLTAIVDFISCGMVIVDPPRTYIA